MEFRELVTRDAQSALDSELQQLKFICAKDSREADTITNDFDGFSRLFAKFLAPDSREGVQWDKIKKAPAESVPIKNDKEVEWWSSTALERNKNMSF